MTVRQMLHHAAERKRLASRQPAVGDAEGGGGDGPPPGASDAVVRVEDASAGLRAAPAVAAAAAALGRLWHRFTGRRPVLA
jgi:hypothetical protein